jgi:cytochrome P450
VVVGDVVHAAALNIIAEAAFHTKTKEELEEINTCFSLVRANLTVRLLHFTAIGRALSPSLRRVDAAKRRFGSYVARTSARFREEGLVATEGSGRTIFDYLLNAPGFTAENVQDHAVTMMFAGFDTSSNSLQWLLALLAANPAVQQRLYDELAASVGLASVPQVDDLKKCAYLDAVIREGMRMFTVVASVARLAAADDVLPSKAIVPAGYTVMVPFHGFHYKKEIYGEDVDAFRPERWFEPGLRARVDANYGFIPFSIGRRHCIGKDFAWNELTTLLTVLVRNFSFVLAPGEKFPTNAANLLTVPLKYSLDMTLRSE